MFSTLIQILINGLVLGSIYVLVAIGLTLIFSIMGIINFAHGGILMLGAFLTYVFTMKLGLNFFISLILSMGAVSLLGILVERMVFRPLKGNELNILVISLGLAIILEDFALVTWGPDEILLPFPKLGVIQVGEVYFSGERLGIIGLSAIFVLGLYLFIQRTKTGAAIRAVAQDRDAATLQGIDSNPIFSFSFAIGCALAAVAGSLMGPLFLVSPFMGLVPMMKAFVVIVLGGLGSIYGALLGGLILGMAESFGATIFGPIFQNVISFLILIIVLVFKPTGLFGEHE